MTVANVSAFGTSCTIVSTVTFPSGFNVSDFADDVDPIQVGNLTIRTRQMLMDGSIHTRLSANPIEVTLAVIPGSPSDKNLQVLFNASRVRQKLLPIPDFIGMMISYPDGVTSALIDGSIISGPPVRSVSMSGRIKTNQYGFVFADNATIGDSVVGTLLSVASAGLRYLG